MRGLLALVFALLVAANTVNSGAIYRRYRELELPAGGGQSAAQLLPSDSYVSELRKDQIPVQVVEVIEPVLVVKPIENLRSVEPQIAIAESEQQAAVITNEILPEKLEKLEENLEAVRAIEQAVVAKEQELQQPIAEAVVAIAEQGQGLQQLRNIEPEAPAAPAILLVQETPSALFEKKEELPLAEAPEKKLLLEAALPVAPAEALPEVQPEILLKEPLLAAIIDEKKPEESKPLAAELPTLKAIKAEEPIVKEIIPETPAIQEIALPAAIEKQSELKSLEEQAAPSEIQPQLKALKEEGPLIETPKLEALLEERKEELLEKKQEAIKEEKKEILREGIQEAIKEELKEVLKGKIPAEIELDPKESEAPIPISGRQADSANPISPTTARPAQPGFIQQLVQNTPLGQLLNNFNGANNQAAPEPNTPIATAATFIQALQNTTSQITNSIQQGFQQQLQSLQTTFTGQQPQPAAASSPDAAAPAATPRPQGPFQSIVTSFLGNGNQGQPQTAPAPAQQGGGPLQGILNLFGGNRAPGSSTPTLAPAAAIAPAAEPLAVKDEAAPSETAASASEEASPEAARDSVEAADDSLEAAKPDEIVVNDDDSHE